MRRALGALFGGAIGKDVVSRAWHKVRSDWEAWQKRDLAGDDIVRLILDGTVVRVRLDRKATSPASRCWWRWAFAATARRCCSPCATWVAKARQPGALSWMTWWPVARSLATPELLIVDGAAGLDKAVAALWNDVPVQRCTVHKHRNLLAHAPKKLYDEVSADYTDMIYAKTAAEVEAKRKAFLHKWRLRCPPVATSLEEAGEKLFTFLRFPDDQWKSIRTTNAIERLHEEFKRRIKTQCMLPCADTACMLFWALMASGQITLRKVDGWKTLHLAPVEQLFDQAA